MLVSLSNIKTAQVFLLELRVILSVLLRRLLLIFSDGLFHLDMFFLNVVIPVFSYMYMYMYIYIYILLRRLFPYLSLYLRVVADISGIRNFTFRDNLIVILLPYVCVIN